MHVSKPEFALIFKFLKSLWNNSVSDFYPSSSFVVTLLCFHHKVVHALAVSFFVVAEDGGAGADWG